MMQRIRKLLKIIVIGALVGGVAAAGGLAIEEWNVSRHGASYRSYQFHDLALGALPGMFITERRHEADFQLGEILQHKPVVIAWNAISYASMVAAVFLGYGCVRVRPPAHPREESK